MLILRRSLPILADGAVFSCHCAVLPYISINASHELTLGVILGPINFLPLHGGKEGLGHSIIMGMAGLRERLDNLVHAKQFPELCWMYIVGPGRCETSAAGARFCSDMPDERWT